LVAVGAIGLLGLASVVNDGVRPVRRESVVDPAPAEVLVDFEVASCEVEYGFATALVEVTLRQPLSYVSFTGDYMNSDGEVTGQGLGNLTDAVPGQTYKTEVLYPLTGGGNEGGTCQVQVRVSETV
jgi:hypothetical protein